MGKNVQEFLDFEVDDIITLSDIMTQTAYNSLSTDFRIIETRTYQEPQDAFTYTAYIAEYKPKDGEEKQIMLMVLQVGNDYELRVYYLDSDGSSEDFEALFMEEEEDLVDRFEPTLYFDEDEYEVTFDKQGKSSFGVEVSSTESEGDPDCKTIAEYFTEDECQGNPHAFIEWTGDEEEGYIEVWYGCEIKPEDVEMFHTKSN